MLEECCAQVVQVSGLDAKALENFGTLVMKSLWKLTKILKRDLETRSVSVETLLHLIHNFLVVIPPQEWSRRHAAGAAVHLGMQPLQTVQAILKQVTNALGDEVFEHLGKINDPETSVLYGYLRNITKGPKPKILDRAIATPSQELQQSCLPNERTQDPSDNARDLLRDIFVKIRSRENTKFV